MKSRLPFYLLAAVYFSAISSNGQLIHKPGAQDFYPIDANGRPFQFDTRYKLDGSPFFHEDYASARIITMEGSVFEEIPVKFNVTEKQVQYLKTDGTEMVAMIGIRSIYFKGLQMEDGSFIDTWLSSDKGPINDPSSVLYQLIDSGRISLAKKIEISYRDEKPYGEATITRHYNRKETPYLLLSSGEYHKIEKGIPFFLEILKDKQKQVAAYINDINIKCKSMQDYRLVVAFYNSLQ